MRIDSAGRQYTTAGGERRAYTCYLLRRSFRDEHGRPRKETLANLSALPDNAITALRKILKDATLVDAEEAFQTERSIPHGDVAVAHVMAAKLGLWGSKSRPGVLTWVIGVLGGLGMIVCRVGAPAVSDLSPASEPVVVARPLVGV